MAKKDIKFTLDTIDSRYSPVGTVKQLDSVFFYIKITENGVTKDLTGQTIKLFAIKEDKKIVEQTTKINITNQSEGLVEIELLNAAIQVHGFTYFELEISDSNGIISTADFILRVNKRVGSDEAIESTNEVSTLKKVEAYVAKAKVELEEFKKIQSEILSTNGEINTQESLRIAAENRRIQAEIIREEKIEQFGSKVAKIENEFSLKQKSNNLVDEKNIEKNGYYAYDTGVWVERSDINSTGLVPCKSNLKFMPSSNGLAQGGNVTFWSGDNKFISGLNVVAGDCIEVPNDFKICYFRISFYNYLENYMINVGEEILEFDRYNACYDLKEDVNSPNINQIDISLKELEVAVEKLKELEINNEKLKELEVSVEKLKTNSENMSLFLKGTLSYNNDISTMEYRAINEKTTFWLTRINKNKFDGKTQMPSIELTSGTEDVNNPAIKNVFNFTVGNGYNCVINGGIFNVTTSITDGILIINSRVLQDKESTDIKGQYILGIKNNGDLKAYRDGTTTSTLLEDGVKHALVGFVPVIENGEINGDEILNICPHATQKHPRQVIGQFKSNDYFIFTCDGRTKGEEGMTLKEVGNVLKNFNVRFAYNLDGGGSTQTFVGDKMINRLIEGRSVPNVITFSNQ